MRGKCRHRGDITYESAIVYADASPGPHVIAASTFGIGVVGQARCCQCDQVVPQGPAAHTEWVEYEIRAAEMAIERIEAGEPFGVDRFDSCPTADDKGLCDVCQWLYLARCIAAHDTALTRGGGEES